VPRDDLEAFSQVGLNAVTPDKDLVAVTTRRFKYILDFKLGTEELYDLDSDSGETRNIAEANIGLASEFHEKALRFRKIETARRMGVSPAAKIDDELRRQLESLGYLERAPR
jgi:hypothetical protein